MKQVLAVLALSFFTTVAFAQAPTVASAVNGASYTVAGLPNSGIAQGSIFILFGTNMGPGALQGAPTLPLQNTLAGTSIRISSGATSVQAFMLYTSANQVAAVMPSNAPVGSDTLTLTYNSQTSASLTIQVVQSNFGAFTLNQGGNGTAVILDANNVPITALHPAAPGQVVVLWGTGLGPITTGDATGAPAGNMTSVPVDVVVGTAHAVIDYRGRAPGFVGLDQINFHVPDGQLGCNVSVSVKINNIVSNFTSIAVATGPACSDPNGIDANTLQLLNSKGSLNIGGVSLLVANSSFTFSGFSSTSVSESGGADFFRITKDALLNSSNSSSSFSQVSIGGCSIFTSSGTSSGGGGGSGSGTLPGYTGLDAGTAITVNGPNGSRQLPKLTGFPGTYEASLGTTGETAVSYLVPGNYTFSGPGGADIPAFTATMNGSLITWSNSSLTSVPRTQDLNITWSGGTAGNFVYITGGSFAVSGTKSTGAVFTCIAPAAPGQFAVPSAVLLALPVSSAQIPGTLSVGGYTFSPVNIPGLDFASGTFVSLTAISVSYQ
jgi:uncharacterized protein (TIGR03437 family)